MKRTTENVLRDEVAKAAKAVDAANGASEAARLRVVSAMEAKKTADAARDDAAARLRRAEAALAAFLPVEEPAP